LQAEYKARKLAQTHECGSQKTLELRTLDCELQKNTHQ
jgi:hypothetical protein